jgi:hypothetical protein
LYRCHCLPIPNSYAVVSLDKSSIARRLRYAKNDAHIDSDLD